MKQPIEKALEKYKSLELIIKDLDGNILYPKDKDKLKFYERIIDLVASDQKDFEKLEHNECYDEMTNKWYLFESCEDIENNCEFSYILDISYYKEKEHKLKTDVITGLSNRAELIEKLNEYLKYAKENQESFSVVMADIDDFKRLNDTYGHDCGDIALQEVAGLIKKNIRCDCNRGTDIIGRIGGDEFLLVIKNIKDKDCQKRIDEIRQEVENHKIEFLLENDDSLTMSFGIYHVFDFEILKIENIEEFRSDALKKADIALYKSKENGKNRSTEYADEEMVRRKII